MLVEGFFFFLGVASGGKRKEEEEEDHPTSTSCYVSSYIHSFRSFLCFRSILFLSFCFCRFVSFRGIEKKKEQQQMSLLVP